MDTVKTVLPYVTTLLLLGGWLALVVLHLAPADGFLTALTGALAGLGVHSVHVGVGSSTVPTVIAEPVKTDAPPAA